MVSEAQLRRHLAWIVCAWSIVAPTVVGQPETVELERAEALLRDCRAREAADAFTAILSRLPDDERAIAGRIEAWIDADRWTEALAEAHRLGERGRSRAILASAIGAALYRGGFLSEARDVLADPEVSDALTARGLSVLGSIRLAEGRGTDAIELMRRALDADPRDPRVVLRTAEATPTRAEAALRLARYLEIGARDDADRREGARGTLRWIEALGERRVWRTAAMPERLVLPIEPLRGVGGEPVAVVVSTRLGPKRRAARLLLDTGSGGLFLVDRVARRGGFEPLAQETAFGGGGSERHRSARGLIPSVSFDGLEFLDALVTTTTVEIDPTGRYHGVLGPGVFEGYRLLLDFREGLLTLDRQAAEPEHGVPYWEVAGQILVSAAAHDGPPGLFLLDTGATQSVLDVDYVARVPGARIGERTTAHGYGGAVGGARRVERVRIELLGRATRGPFLVATDLGTRSRLGGVEIAGYIGMDLLAGTVLIIDPFSRRVDLRGAR